jgi:uncharacterized protein YgbK (DUF1537 family)
MTDMVPRVVVLDDDPTGTQCASDVAVALKPDPAGLLGFDDRQLYVLTNTRAVDAQAAARIVRDVRTAFEQRGDDATMVLRGDSTLRGHVAAEMHAMGLADGVGLIVPAYPAAGRVTVGGAHYLDTPAGRVNVADTEFAGDPVFGFRSRTLADWSREVGLRGPVVHVGLDEIRPGGAAPVRDALLDAPPGAVVIPDALTDEEITAIAQGFSESRAEGRRVVVRCAAPLAAAIAGTPGRLLDPEPAAVERLLVVCGSHTAAATLQLERLAGDRHTVRTLPTGDPYTSDTPGEVAEKLRRDLADTGLAIVATERVRREEYGTLDHAARVMASLMRVVRSLADEVDSVVSKGGITSAEVATTGLGGRWARVRGQITVGVPLWDVAGRYGRLVPQAVVPGNVGGDSTLVNVCGFFGVR